MVNVTSNMSDKLVHFQIKMERNCVETDKIMNYMQSFAVLGGITYMCDICDSEFTVQENLTQYKCVKCNYSYDVCDKCTPRTDGCYYCDTFMGMYI
jgi:hypothetical protein